MFLYRFYIVFNLTLDSREREDDLRIVLLGKTWELGRVQLETPS